MTITDRTSAEINIKKASKKIARDIRRELKDAGASEYLLKIFTQSTKDAYDMIQWDVYGCAPDEIENMVRDDQAMQLAGLQYIKNSTEFDIRDDKKITENDRAIWNRVIEAASKKQ